MEHGGGTSNDYALGHARQELERLVDQGRFIGDLSGHMLGLAGLKPGMRVLDVGCGAGDVSFLALSLVGPDATVIGVDRVVLRDAHAVAGGSPQGRRGRCRGGRTSPAPEQW